MDYADIHLMTKFLSIGVPSHTRYYQDLVQPFRQYMQSLPPLKMQYPLLSAYTLSINYQPIPAIDSLANELANTLQWYSLNRMLEEYGVDMVITIDINGAMQRLLTQSGSHIHSVVDISKFKTMDGLVRYLQQRLV